MVKWLRSILLVGLILVFSTVMTLAQDAISAGDTVEEEADGEIVEYEIELEEDQTITISLESEDFDTLIKVLDEDEDVVGEDDDGGEGFNSLLEFTAPDSGTYIIQVNSFYGEDAVEGDYTLSIEGEDGGDDDGDSGSSSSGDVDMAYGDEIDFDVDGEEEIEITFEGEEGDVVTIITRADAEQDIRIILEGPDGDEVASNSEYNFGDAFLLRVPLFDDGVYTIILSETDDEELEDEIEVSLEESELLDLGEGEQTVEIDSRIGEDYMVFLAEEDTVYTFTITLDGDIDSTTDIEIGVEGAFFSELTSISLQNIEEVTFEYEAPDDDVIFVNIEYWGFSGDIEITVEVDS